MKNVWVRWSGLALLDDNAEAVYTSRLGEALSRSVDHKALHAPPSRTPAPTQTPAPSASKAPLTKSVAALQTKKIFTSSPTLRQLMNEYNRPVSRLAPIKTTAIQPKSPTSADQFEFDEIDFIQLTNIPGRILRPSSS